MLVNATNMLLKARDGHYGVGQFNINNLEWTRAFCFRLRPCRARLSWAFRGCRQIYDRFQDRCRHGARNG